MSFLSEFALKGGAGRKAALQEAASEASTEQLMSCVLGRFLDMDENTAILQEIWDRLERLHVIEFNQDQPTAPEGGEAEAIPCEIE